MLLNDADISHSVNRTVKSSPVKPSRSLSCNRLFKGAQIHNVVNSSGKNYLVNVLCPVNLVYLDMSLSHNGS